MSFRCCIPRPTKFTSNYDLDELACWRFVSSKVNIWFFSLVTRPRKLKKVKRNINKWFSWINSRFISASPSAYYEKIVKIKSIEIPKQEHVQLNCISRSFIDRYKGDVYMQLLRKNPHMFMTYFLNLAK